MAHKLTLADPAADFLGGNLKRSAALFLLVPSLLAGCAQGPGSAGTGGFLAPAAPTPSTLDDAGIAKIKADKKAVLDLRAGKLTKGAALGDKDANIEVPEGLDLTILMPKGSIEVKATRLGYATSSERLGNELTYLLQADTNDAYFALLNDGKKHGVPGFPIDQWVKAVTQTPDMSTSTDLGVGYATGLAMRYETKVSSSTNARRVEVTLAEQPSYAPAAATPLGTMGSDKDPMSQYVESITTPEEKVARLRAYTALPEILNAASPVHENPTAVYQDLFEKDIITARYRDQNKEQTEWGTGQYPARNMGYTHQVTGLYCPMHAQTLAVLDRGFLSCNFTGNYMLDGEPVHHTQAEDGTEWIVPASDDIQQAQVYMAKDGDTWKVDNIKFQR